MVTNTNYFMHQPEVIKKKIVTLGEAYGMSQQKIDEHFENVAKQNSYQHCIMIEAPIKEIQRMKHETRVDYNTKTAKRIGKRYRIPGRC